MAEKVCKDCGEPKELAAFGKNKNRADGHASRCKDCLAARARKGRAAGTIKDKPPSLFKTVRDHRHQARDLARNALKSGKLRKPLRCEDCGTPKKPEELQMHHPNHRSALDVQFVCRNCHQKKE